MRSASTFLFVEGPSCPLCFLQASWQIYLCKIEYFPFDYAKDDCQSLSSRLAEYLHRVQCAVRSTHIATEQSADKDYRLDLTGGKKIPRKNKQHQCVWRISSNFFILFFLLPSTRTKVSAPKTALPFLRSNSHIPLVLHPIEAENLVEKEGKCDEA